IPGPFGGNMARNLSGTGWISLACAAALLVACNKEGGGGSAPNPLEGGAAAAAGPLDYLPKDAGLVVGFNWSKFKGTKFHNLITTNLPADSKTKLDEFKAACSIDPLNDLESITVGVVGNLDKQSKAVVVVKGNWDEDKISKCATAYGTKQGKKVTVTKADNITSYTPENDKTLNVGWAGNLMVFTSQSMEGDKTYLAEVMKKASTVKDNKPVMELLGKSDQGATIYGAFVPPPGSDAASAFNKMTGGKEQLAGAHGTIKLASDLDTVFGLRFGSD